MDENTTNIQGKQAVNIESSAKPFHRFFTGHIIATFLIVAMTLSLTGVFLFQQAKQAKTLIAEQLIPLQTQLLQQTYLINTDKLIDNTLQNSNAHELLILQQQLLLQSKKLLLLKSEYQRDYQQWFSRNTLASRIVTRIESSDTSNEALKHKALIQLKTLLDALKIQITFLDNNSVVAPLDKQQKTAAQIEQLSAVEKQLHTAFIMLDKLTLHMPLSKFEQLRNQINALFVVDYPKQLIESQRDNQAMADIFRDLIRFENLILKRGVLDKWHEQLRLMKDYQQQLVEQQQQLQSILYQLSKDDYGIDTQSSGYIKANKDTLNASKLPQWIMVALTAALFSVLALLWLIKARIKLMSKENFTRIEHSFARDKKILTTTNPYFYSAEAEQLVNKIQQIPCDHDREDDFAVLKERNQVLETQMLQDKSTQEQLQRDLASLELAMSTRTKATLLLEQKRSTALYVSGLKQLMLLGKSALTLTKNTNHSKVINHYLCQAHLQAQDLVCTLRQASCYRYLQSSEAVLRLAQVNLANQIQAITLNLHGELLRCNNSLSVSMDEKIHHEVNLDKALFSELINTFIKLLLTGQTDKKLSFNLLLVDNNSDQQKIFFSAEIEGKGNAATLPQILQVFSDESIEHNEHTAYFNTLLRFLQGNNVNVTITEQGYQLGFTFTLGIINNQQTQYYPTLLLPSYLADIENTCLELSAKYLAMPIEVLIAAKQPIQYQRLQQLLHSIGLQVTFVTDEVMLEKNWQSGRFTLLMTEIACQPFIRFITDTDAKPSAKDTLVRGVFDLIKRTDSRKPPSAYEHWVIGEVTADSTENEIIAAMRPWLTLQKKAGEALEKVSVANTKNNTETPVIQRTSLARERSVSFNIERYIHHQGSAELAIFMLAEYTAENTVLVKQLSQAFINDDAIKVAVAAQSLLVNSKILAADYLVHLCQHWQKLLTNKVLDKHNKVQISLLKKTKKAVADINKYADDIV
ncbi:hypothetical protein [Colwellia ponticola]|uniref:Uncharacterized protein n=1 Tax=Colwellia ponticola TaxID=2304625 RepID=A0A8H2JNJ5_9GAMM|nr:hypothetical protein [Colwellia ponticola]TMM45621.1 hypothetical protein FCS21_07295 [Colwellia ponticola]